MESYKKRTDEASLEKIIKKRSLNSTDGSQIVKFSKKYECTIVEIFWWEKLRIEGLLWRTFTLIDMKKRGTQNYDPTFFSETEYACYTRKWCNFTNFSTRLLQKYK